MVDLLDYQQVADQYNLKYGTLRRLVRQHRIPHVRLGLKLVRFHRGELDQWIEEQALTRTGIDQMAAARRGINDPGDPRQTDLPSTQASETRQENANPQVNGGME